MIEARVVHDRSVRLLVNGKGAAGRTEQAQDNPGRVEGEDKAAVAGDGRTGLTSSSSDSSSSDSSSDSDGENLGHVSAAQLRHPAQGGVVTDDEDEGEGEGAAA